MSAHAATAELKRTEAPPSPARRAPEPDAPVVPAGASFGVIAAATLAFAGLLCFVTFLAGGGLGLASMTTVELVLTLGAGVVVALVALLAPPGTRARGAWPVGLLIALAGLTALSVVWSVAPDSSWEDAGRMLAYSGVFAAAVALARIVPGAWRALLGAIVLGAAVVCGYALLTKVLPNRLDAADTYARLQEPYGYWNAVGLTAAMGAVACMWLGARRAGHALLSALSYPAMGVMLVALMLAYSRGALIVFAAGVALWLGIVPLRLRGARVLIVATLGAAPVVAWTFAQSALSDEKVALGPRTTAGHQLGVILFAMLLLLAIAGIAIGFFGSRRAPSVRARRNVGAALLALLALSVLVAGGALEASSRGLTGTISHDFSSLTNPNAPVPPNTPGRLTAIASVRARYWNEALEIFEAHPVLGVGAAGYETARLRYRTETLDVKHAHGYVVQTLADLGIVGLALSLALLACWMACAGRATRPLNGRWTVRRRPLEIHWNRTHELYSPERVGLLSMLCVTVVFGLHSLADWTWYVPGNALVALLCAGWLAGRGPLSTVGAGPIAGAPLSGEDASGLGWRGMRLDVDRRRAGVNEALARLRAPGRLGAGRIAVIALVLAGALLAAWAEWQPQRSAEASEQALTLLPRDPSAARARAQSAVNEDPLSASALFTLSAIQRATGEPALARATLAKAVTLQPSDPQTWLALGQYDMALDPHRAIGELRAAVYLDPESVPIQNAYVQALRASPSTTTSGGTAVTAGAQKRRRRALASSTRRAPGRPPAPRTSTSSKPKSSSRSTSARRS